MKRAYGLCKLSGSSPAMGASRKWAWTAPALPSPFQVDLSRFTSRVTVSQLKWFNMIGLIGTAYAALAVFRPAPRPPAHLVGGAYARDEPYEFRRGLRGRQTPLSHQLRRLSRNGRHDRGAVRT